MILADLSPLTRFEYLYRDAGNFKAFGHIDVQGNLTSEERDEIVNRLEGRAMFIAEQIGIPPLYASLYRFSNGPISSDHCWHEFVNFKDLPADADQKDVWGTTDKLLQRFRSIADWDIQISPHFAM